MGRPSCMICGQPALFSFRNRAGPILLCGRCSMPFERIEGRLLPPRAVLARCEQLLNRRRQQRRAAHPEDPRARRASVCCC